MCTEAGLDLICVLHLIRHLKAQMNISSFVAHHESVHGKLSEVMKE